MKVANMPEPPLAPHHALNTWLAGETDAVKLHALLKRELDGPLMKAACFTFGVRSMFQISKRMCEQIFWIEVERLLKEAEKPPL